MSDNNSCVKIGLRKATSNHKLKTIPYKHLSRGSEQQETVLTFDFKGSTRIQFLSYTEYLAKALALASEQY